MKIFVRASIATAVLATAPSQAAFPADVTAVMDTTADPCEDFYQYSCGNWLKNTPLPDDETYYPYADSNIEKRNELVIQDIIKEDWPLIGEFWDSCTALDKMTALGAQPLQHDLDRIAAVTTKKELAMVAGDLGGAGPSLLTGMYYGPDLVNATINILGISNPTLVLPAESYYLDNSTFTSVEAPFRKYISKIIQLSGIQASSSEHAENVVIAMETKLAEILPTSDEFANRDTLKYSEAASKYPLTFGAMAQGKRLLEKKVLTADSVLDFTSLPFMDRAEKFFNASELDDLKLYYSFLYVHMYVKFLGEPFVAANFALFGTELQGIPSRPSREKVCTSALIKQFPDLIGKYYFLKAFDIERQNSVELMVDAIEKSMSEHIEVLSWLDEPTRKQAQTKLSKVSNLIGRSTQKKSYPFVLKRDNYFDTMQTIWTSNWAQKLANVNKPVDKTEWSTSAATVNAFYSPQKNQMLFPAAILQPPLFNGSSHPAQNFGAIGAVIGHELTHGFDDSGSLYDGDGNQVDWWSAESFKEFETRAQCMKDQYSTFVAVGASGKQVGMVNGNLTIGENIADNGGLSLAFDAYHEWIKNGATFSKNGVTDDEADKLFFVSYGLSWCTKVRDEYQKQLLTSGVHSPPQWRVNGAAMNSVAFADTFQCKAGSKMNPATKCKLWQT